MTDEFEPGDQVVLKSGGPPMTVERVYEDGFINGEKFTFVSAVWFDGNDYHQDSFRSTSLEALSDVKHAHGLLGKCTKWMRDNRLTTLGGKTDGDRLYSEIVDFLINQHQDGYRDAFKGAVPDLPDPE